MIGLRAFALTRHWNIVVLIIVLTACAIYLCGPFAYNLNPREGYLVAVAAQLPVVSAIAIQVTLDEPRLRIPELTARRHLSGLRLLHVVGLTALAAGATAIAGSYLAGAADQTLAATTVTGLGPFGLVRNLLALSGLALVSGFILGAQWGWVLPLAWAVVPYFVTSPRDDPAGVATLLAQPDRALLPFLVAVALFLTGTSCAARTPSTTRTPHEVIG